MAGEDPVLLASRIAAAERRGDSSLAAELRRQLLADHPNSPEARAIAPRSGVEHQGRDIETIQLVRVVDVDVKFITMVSLFVKAAIATIPAAIIVALLYAMLIGVVGVLVR